MSNSSVVLSPEPKEHQHECKDRISELPDHILRIFLSSLEMRDAARTSIISKRWRYLWADWTDLDFEPSKILQECNPDIYECTPAQITKYVNWVNQVVSLHYGPSIDKFRIWFYFGENDLSGDVERWLRFAISKRVKKLDIGLIDGSFGFRYGLGFSLFKDLPSDCGITSLTSLQLRGVDVSGEFLEFILSQCHLLEQLSVVGSEDLVSFKVMEPSSCKLKHLTILRCPNLRELEIHALSLVSFEYYEVSLPPDVTNLVFGRAPALVEAVVGGECCCHSFPIFKQMKSIFLQLTKLSFELFVVGYDIPMEVLPSFVNVKDFEVLISVMSDSNLLALTRFIKACPVLVKFKLKVFWIDHKPIPSEAIDLQDAIEEGFGDSEYDGGECPNTEVEENSTIDYSDSEIEEVSEVEGNIVFEASTYSETEALHGSWSHPTLKILELGDYIGCDADVEFILNVVDVATNLETIICAYSSCKYPSRAEWIDASRTRAKKLARIINGELNVVIPI